MFFAALGPISKGLHTNSVAEHCETLKAQAYRDAPTLLEYTPSYKGVLRKKTKKEGEPIVKKKAGPSETQGAGRGQKLPRVRLPTFRKSADYWFGLENEVQEPILPRLNVPLRTVAPIFDDDMSRRNVPQPVIPTRTLAPARSRVPLDT